MSSVYNCAIQKQVRLDQQRSRLYTTIQRMRLFNHAFGNHIFFIRVNIKIQGSQSRANYAHSKGDARQLHRVAKNHRTSDVSCVQSSLLMLGGHIQYISSVILRWLGQHSDPSIIQQIRIGILGQQIRCYETQHTQPNTPSNIIFLAIQRSILFNYYPTSPIQIISFLL
ncbi:hypothetical protein FGO68_gene6371 [Halteria grandinella]|uniref:Uncharacterized protein n=1 Tax=Halteria grandinella TaxID=5974 RepID=A0A8J8SX70_HALGN|nr:hypothetical protein FGO68_gene6371 [Halteria grandinella]